MATVTATTSTPVHTKDHSFAARFGTAIIKGGVAPVPMALLRYQGEIKIPLDVLGVVVQLLAYKRSEEMPVVSLKRMAKQIGVSQGTLHNYKNWLLRHKLLRIVRRNSPQQGKLQSAYDFSPLFKILVEKLERDGVGADYPFQPTDVQVEVVEDAPPEKQARTLYSAKRGNVRSESGFSTPHLNTSEMGISTRLRWDLRQGEMNSKNTVKEDSKETVNTVPPPEHVKLADPDGELTAFKKSSNDNGTTGERPPERPAGTFTGPPSKRTANGSPPQAQEEALMLEMAESLGDRGSNGFYRLVARHVPPPLIFRALGEVKEAAREHTIKKSKGALFTAKIKKFAKEQGITLGIKSG